VDYTQIVGVPIIFPKIENPSKEDIQKYQKIYIRELSLLYEEYKGEYGMGDVTLRIA